MSLLKFSEEWPFSTKLFSEKETLSGGLGIKGLLFALESQISSPDEAEAVKTTIG